VPTLDKHVEMQKNGVPGLFTPKGFNTAYTEYQKYMIDELNESTAGMHMCRPPQWASCQVTCTPETD
jgi:superoxide dismutase